MQYFTFFCPRISANRCGNFIPATRGRYFRDLSKILCVLDRNGWPASLKAGRPFLPIEAGARFPRSFSCSECSLRTSLLCNCASPDSYLQTPPPATGCVYPEMSPPNKICSSRPRPSPAASLPPAVPSFHLFVLLSSLSLSFPFSKSNKKPRHGDRPLRHGEGYWPPKAGHVRPRISGARAPADGTLLVLYEAWCSRGGSQCCCSGSTGCCCSGSPNDSSTRCCSSFRPVSCGSTPNPPLLRLPKNLPHHSNPTDCKIPLNPYQRAALSAAAALARNCSPSISPVSHCRSLL